MVANRKLQRHRSQLPSYSRSRRNRRGERANRASAMEMYPRRLAKLRCSGVIATESFPSDPFGTICGLVSYIPACESESFSPHASLDVVYLQPRFRVGRGCFPSVNRAKRRCFTAGARNPASVSTCVPRGRCPTGRFHIHGDHAQCGSGTKNAGNNARFGRSSGA